MERNPFRLNKGFEILETQLENPLSLSSFRAKFKTAQLLHNNLKSTFSSKTYIYITLELPTSKWKPKEKGETKVKLSKMAKPTSSRMEMKILKSSLFLSKGGR